MTAKFRPVLVSTFQHARVEAHRLEGNEKFHRGYQKGCLECSRWWAISGACVGFALGAAVVAGTFSFLGQA